MSDPPPRKVGSLRDRIAAFENKGPASTPAPAPVPRPKPAGGVQWKPKPISPPSSPRSSADQHAEHKQAGGMSASDAKESIGKGVSLKERMAALQGKGGFGGFPGVGSVPPPPKPATEKPKWKPPPAIVSPRSDDDEHPAEPKEAHASSASPPPHSEDDHDHATAPHEDAEKESETKTAEGPAEEEKEVDPEEEERQRRAAIAARMARLGGARVGMAPPVFGRKPDIKKPSPPKEVQAPVEPKVTTVTPPSVEAPTEDATPEPVTEKPTDTQPSSSPSPPVVSPEPTAPATTSRPTAMPVPAVPRRAGPPRRKLPKEPTATAAAAPPSIDSEAPQVPTDAPDSATLTTTEVDSKAQEPESAPANDEGQQPQDTPDLPAKPSTPPISDNVVKDVHVPAPTLAEEPEKEIETVAPREEEAQATETKVDEGEEDEAARRQRIAERVAKMGGYNPFGGGAPPAPVRKPSLTPSQHAREDSGPTRRDSVEAPPPIPPHPPRSSSTSTSIRRDSVDSAGSPSVPPPPRRTSVRQGSVDSVASRSDSVRSPPPPPLPTSPKPDVQARRESVGSVGSGPTRRFSQDDRKPFAIPEVIPQRHFSEEISEEPEGDTIDTTEQTHGIGHHQFAAHADSDSGSEVATSAPQGLGYESPGEESEKEDQGDDHTPVVAQDDTEDLHRMHVDEVSYSYVAEKEAPKDQLPQVEESSRPSLETEFVPPPPPPPLPHPERRISVPPPARIPPPPPITRPIPPPPVISPLTETEAPSEDSSPSVSPPPLAPRPPPRVPPPPPVFTANEEDEGELEDGEEADSPALSPIESRDSVSFLDIQDATGQATPPVPARPVPAPRGQLIYDDSREEGDEEDEEEDVEEQMTEGEERAAPLEVRRKSLPPPPPRPPPAPPKPEEDEDEDFEYEEEKGNEHEVLDEEDGDPIDPGFIKSPHTSLQPPPRAVPPPPPPPPVAVDVEPTPSPPPVPISTPSPPLPATAPINNEEEDADEERARRRTIAERMAKLGGLRFGAPPPVRRPQPPPPPEESPSQGGGSEEVEQQTEEPEQEEDEFARKQRIAARIAGMGGMRFGMFPGAVPPPPPVVSPKDNVATESGNQVVERPPPPPTRFVPPPPPPPVPITPPESKDEDYEQVSGSPLASDDGVHVEAEDDEMEDVNLVSARDEAPPPIPTREGRRASLTPSIPSRPPPVPSAYARPPVPTGRPPIPGPQPIRRPSLTVPSTILEAPKAGAGFDGIPPPPPIPPSSEHSYPPVTPITPIVQSDYVIVETEDATEEPPPLPPPRPSRAPPPRAVPPPPPPADPPVVAASKHKSMPSLSSSIDFGQEADLSFSAQFSQGTSNYQAPIFSPPPPPRKESLRTSTAKPTSHLSTVAVPPPPPVQPPAPPVVEQQLSADDLMLHWGRVGVQIHEAATHLLEKSRKSLVGDGSYVGFVVASLTRVPTAVQPTPPYESFGYLSYSQSGSSVQRRASDIMPGDIIELHDAKFKGHKGLQSYHQNVGIGERLVAVVADFEVKKSKVKVFQANQHVGQQSVETASYRLEDLKSGSVKVYRVLAA